MRHIFIINPAAGKHRRACARVPEIEAFFAANPSLGTPEIVYTQEQGHATRLAAAYAQSGEAVRLYACGGDGTLSEVLRGMYQHENAELACLPCGSANDYVRTFPERDFENIAALVTGHAHSMDVIKCGNTVSLGIACMGMDADVAAKMVKYKRLPLVSGPMAYQLAIVDVFFHRIGKNLTVTIQTPHGEVTRSGRYFFALAASGQYYGGGYRGAPMARPDDGLLDFILVKAMPRIRIPAFLSRYKKGAFTDSPLCEHFTGTKMTVSCPEGAALALDGECLTDTFICFELLDRSVRFVLPQRGTVQQPSEPNQAAAFRRRQPGAACAAKNCTRRTE